MPAEFGIGAVIGISTSRPYARGPIAPPSFRPNSSVTKLSALGGDFPLDCLLAGIRPARAQVHARIPRCKIKKNRRATADEDGHLYEASRVKRFLRDSTLLLRKSACGCIHGVMAPCLAVLSRSSPNARRVAPLGARA